MKTQSIPTLLFFLLFISNTLLLKANPSETLEAQHVSLAAILPTDVSPAEVLSYEMIDQGEACSIYEIHLADGRVVYQVVSMAALKALPIAARYVCLGIVKVPTVCRVIQHAGEAIIDLYGAGMAEKASNFFTSRIEGDHGVASVAAETRDGAEVGKQAFEMYKNEGAFPWQPAAVRSFQNYKPGSTDFFDNFTLANILHKFKESSPQRSRAIYLTDNLNEQQISTLRSLYRIPKEEFIIGAYSDVTWTGSFFFDQFDEGIVFTNKSVCVRNSASQIYNGASYEYIHNSCVVEISGDDHIRIADDGGQIISYVKDNELSPAEMVKLIDDLCFAAAISNKEITTSATTKSKRQKGTQLTAGTGQQQTTQTTVKTQKRKKTTPGSGSGTGNLSKAQQYYNSGDFPNAFNVLYKNKKKLSANQQYLLATLYFEGKGVSKNQVEGAKWFEKAGNGGHIEAILMMGYIYENGFGKKKKVSTAKLWYKKGVKLGSSKAQQRLNGLR